MGCFLKRGPRHSPPLCGHQKNNDLQACAPVHAVQPSDIRRCVMEGAEQIPAKTSVPFSASPEEKLGIYHTTREGLVLSRGPNGELHATIANQENKIGIGYVRKDGAYSAEPSWTTIYQNGPGYTSQVELIKQEGTYSLKVEHHGRGRTTLVIDMDPSLAAMRIQAGPNVYLLQESDIRELDRKTEDAAKTTTQTPPLMASPLLEELTPLISESEVTPPIPLLSSSKPVLPAMIGNLSTALRTYEPAVRAGVQNAVRALEDATRRAERSVRLSPKTEIAPSPSDKKASTQNTSEATRPADATGSASLKPERGFYMVERAKHFFERQAESFREWVKKGAEDSPEAQASRSRAEKYGEAAGLGPEEIARRLAGEVSPRKVSSPPSVERPQKSLSSDHASIQSSPPHAGAASAPAIGATADMNARLIDALKRFNDNARVSEWAKNNQFKALTLCASLSEAVTGAMKANYQPDDTHSPVPHLLKLLNADIERAFEFTTKQGGVTAAIVAEAASSAGDTALAFGAFQAADAGVMAAASTQLGQKLGGKVVASVAGRAIGFAGVAYHGYSTFSDGSFVLQNDLQLTGSTASPVVMGAIMGSPLGPVGAGAGAALGAGSEAVGVAVGYARLQGEIDADWRKREVREAIRLAEQGFILPDHASQVRSRKPFDLLLPEHQQVLTDVARLAALARLSRELPPADLRALGFKSEPKQDSSVEERNAVGAHNWDRMIQLTEGRSGYNPYRLWAGDYVDEIRRERPLLARTFEGFYSEAKDHYLKVYNHAPHVEYANSANAIAEHSELLQYIDQVANSIPTDTSPPKTLERLHSAFPGIEAIMQREESRTRLINNLEGFSGGTGRFRRLLDLNSR